METISKGVVFLCHKNNLQKNKKKKYILFANEIGMIKTLDIFFNEFHSRYENNSSHKNINSFKTFVFTRGKALINNWLYKYNNGMELQSKTGKTGLTWQTL